MNEKKSSFLMIPFLVTLAGVLATIAGYFLPILSSWGESISCYETVKMCFDGTEFTGGAGDTLLISVALTFITPMVFTLMLLLFTALRRPVPIIVFDILNFLCIIYIYTWRKSNIEYAAYVLMGALAVTFAGAAWMLCAKIKIKKTPFLQSTSSSDKAE